MKKLLNIALLVYGISIGAHTIHGEHDVLHHWNLPGAHKVVGGSFSILKNGIVFIEDTDDRLLRYPLTSLSRADQNYVAQKEAEVKAINSRVISYANFNQGRLNYKLTGIALILIVLGIALNSVVDRTKIRYLIPITVVGIMITMYSFTAKAITTTDPEVVNAAFLPFLPNVATSWDNTYFYVESKGVPDHSMMVGISNHGWQQQVPIPQCYIGSNNHWSIPLNPVVASSPIAIDNVHFTKGAIAIAANGVPIFNYHTNTGVDSYLDGQLDVYGGHCGRGDDYHYHIAPLHLYTLGQTTTNLPCAYSFDGYAVYGGLEPDGTSIMALDANHGHYGTNGIYHYHGTANAPYMIANFVGQVTEDATHQLIPQAAAHPVRTENWTPLNGALITSCVPNGTTNGYNLSYALNGVTGYATNYSWTGTTYTFDYVTPATTTSQNYNGFNQCAVPLSTTAFKKDTDIVLHPNPSHDIVYIQLGKDINVGDIKSVTIYTLKGSMVAKYQGFKSGIDIKDLASGTYLVSLQLESKRIDKKMVVK